MSFAKCFCTKQLNESNLHSFAINSFLRDSFASARKFIVTKVQLRRQQSTRDANGERRIPSRALYPKRSPSTRRKETQKFETLIFVSTNRDSKISSERGFQRKQIGGQTPTEKLWQQAAAQGVCANELNYSTGTRSTTAIGCDDESSSPQRPDSVPRKVRAQTF